MPDLHTEHLSLAYERQPVVADLALRIPSGRISALVGPNGSGKSTILKALARLLKPAAGAAYLDGCAIHQRPTRQLARELAILPQDPAAPEGLTVRQLVGYGRFPHQRRFGPSSSDDRHAIERALEITHLTDLAERPVGRLSGGQRQRVWIAMAVAQDTPVLLLDEPTTFLDMAHQLEVLALLERLNGEQQRTIVMVLHDLNHAARFAHHLIAINDGRIIVEGAPQEVVCCEVLQRVFGVEASVIPCPRTGAPLCIAHASGATPCRM